MKKLLLRFIRFYQRRISPLLPPMCRYYPTCSQYAVEAFVFRLMRCNVLFPGGYDPVPPKKHSHPEEKK